VAPVFAHFRKGRKEEEGKGGKNLSWKRGKKGKNSFYSSDRSRKERGESSLSFPRAWGGRGKEGRGAPRLILLVKEEAEKRRKERPEGPGKNKNRINTDKIYQHKKATLKKKSLLSRKAIGKLLISHAQIGGLGGSLSRGRQSRLFREGGKLASSKVG